MAEDIFKPQGSTKSSKPDAGGANTRNVPVYGIVKDNIDPTRSGRLRVYISDMGGNNPDNSDSWIPVYYASPFYGWVQPTAGETGYGTYVTNPSSYGMWYSPPDIGTTVICIFINGDPTYGYWIACVPKIEAMHMVPAIGSSEYIITDNDNEAIGYGGATRLPVTNMNTNNDSQSDSAKFLNEAKPIHSYVASILNQQGLVRDPLRGPISTSANRESPSRVGWGVSTPGRPIYQGGYTDENVLEAVNSSVDPQALEVVSRQGGHSIVMDDGDVIGNDQLIRIRTAKGHQILMSDDGQTLFVIHSNGQTWIELGKEGTIDLFATNSVNIRTQGDLNLHADNNINIHAKKKLNIKSEDMSIESEKSTTHKIGTTYSADTAGTFTHKIGGAMSWQSGGEASFGSGASTFINGSKINLNTGSSSTTPKPVPVIPEIAHTDTLYDSAKGWAAAPGKLQSITSRAPAHSPWANANQGVNIKSTGSANESLPPEPSPQVTATNAAAQTAPLPSPVTTATASTVPAAPSPSKAMDKNTTAAMVGAVAQNAATGAASAAVGLGAAVVSTSQGAVGAVGALAQTASQIEASGVLKPGAGILAESLIKAGANVEAALTNNLFTGAAGAQNLPALVQNVEAQVAGQATLFQKTQAALTATGVITGKEAPNAIAGLIMAGSTASIGGTIGAVKTIMQGYGSVAAAAQGVGQLAGAFGLSGVSKSIGSALRTGNYAANMAQSALGGMAAISNAVNILGKAQGTGDTVSAGLGVAGAAFKAVLNTLTPFQSKVPQNLLAIARKGATTTSALAYGLGAANKAATAITGILNSNNPAQTAGNVTNALGAITAAAGAAAVVSRTLTGTNTGLGSASITTTLSAATNAARSITAATAALTGVGGIFSTTNIPSSVPNINNPAASLNSIGQALGSASNAVRAVKSIGSGNGTLAGTLGTISSATGAFTNAARSLTSLPSASSIASGINGLPGGQNVVSAVVGATPAIPGTENVAALATNTSTAVNNSISLPQSLEAAASSVGNVASSIGGTLSGVASDLAGSLSKTGDLVTSTLKDLTPGISAQVNSAMASINSLGASPIKIPTVGLDTFNRSEIAAQTTALLGDSRIPAPNFSGPSASAKALLESINQRAEMITKTLEESQALGAISEQVKKEFYDLKNTFPAGSPEIEAAKQKYLAALAKESEKIKLAATLAQQQADAYSQQLNTLRL